MLADADGQSSHGLARIPSYAVQLQSRKVNGSAKPSIRRLDAGSIEVRANGGFAYPAIELAVNSLTESGKEHGITMAAIVGSHHCGVAGHPVEKLARKGYIGLMFANTPKAMAAADGTRAVFGTNPISFACPRSSSDPIVIDLSLSVAARGKIAMAARQGESIPQDWGLDESGKASTDPNEVLKGSLKAIGGAKGAALAMMIEIIAAAFCNSRFGFEASSFYDGQGGPPEVGQLLICLAPNTYNQHFLQRIELLTAEILKDECTRIPGEMRFAQRKKSFENGLEYPQKLIDSIRDLISKSSL